MKRQSALATGVLTTLVAILASGFAALHKVPLPQTQLVKKSPTIRYGAYWAVGDGYFTTLILSNSDPKKAITANVLLFSHDGQPVQTAQIHVAPNSTSRLALEDVVKAGNDQMAWGGLMVEVEEKASPSRLKGELLIENSRIGTTIDIPLQSGLRFDTENAVHASWWLPDTGTQGTVSLFNSSAQSIVVSPSIAILGSERAIPGLTLAPLETRRVDLRQMLKAVKAEDNTVGSIAFRYAGPPHALHTALWLTNESTGFHLVPSFNAKHGQPRLSQTTWQFPDVSLFDDGNVVPEKRGPLTAYALLSNGTKSALAPQLTAYFSGDNGQHLLKAVLPIQPLLPFETRLVNLSELLENGKLPAGTSHLALLTGHSGDPGDLAINVFSVSQSRDFVTTSGGALLPAEAVDSSYWKTDSKRSQPAVKNETAAHAQARVVVYYDTKHGVESYVLPLLDIPGYKTKVTTLKQALTSGIPDENGSHLSAALSSGIAALVPVTKDGPAAPLVTPSAECEEDCTLAPALSPAQDKAQQPTVRFVSCPSPPVIQIITPNQGTVGTSIGVTIVGTDLNDFDTVTVSGGVTATNNGVTSDPNCSNCFDMDVTLDIPFGATTGAQNVVVTDPDLGDSNSVPFTLYDPSPMITGVNPQTWFAGTQTRFSIFGSGFGTNPTLTINGAGVLSYSIFQATDSQIDADVTLDPNAPSNTANITVTSNGYGSGFVGAPGHTNQAGVNAMIQAQTLSSARIFYQGNDVTGHTQSTFVGQQIALTTALTLPTGVVVTSQSWTISAGNTVGGYSTSPSNGGPIATDVSQPSLTFYWVTPGSAIDVTFTYSTNGNQSASASTRFDVAAGPSGVTVSAVLAPSPGVNIVPPPTTVSPNNPILIYGALRQAGVVFSALGTAPAGNTGKYVWGQLIPYDQIYRVCPSGPHTDSTFTGPPGISELDTEFPYSVTGTSQNATIPNDTSSDNPTAALISTRGEVGRAFSAKMYLMWQPTPDAGCTSGNACTIPIPLGSLKWQFSGDAINTLKTNTPPIPPGVVVGDNTTTWKLACEKDSSQPVFVNDWYPTWSNTTSGVLPVCN